VRAYLSSIEDKNLAKCEVFCFIVQLHFIKEIFKFLVRFDNLENDLFGYAMKYNNPENTGLSTGRFNGNIAEIDWITSTVANDNKEGILLRMTALTGSSRASTRNRDHH